MYMYQNKYMYHTYITNHHNHTKALNDQSPAWSVGRWFNLTSTYMYTSMPVFNFDTMNWGQVQVKSNGFVVLKNLDVLQSNLECLKWIGISPPPALSIIIPKKQGKEKKNDFKGWFWWIDWVHQKNFSVVHVYHRSLFKLIMHHKKNSR